MTSNKNDRDQNPDDRSDDPEIVFHPGDHRQSSPSSDLFWTRCDHGWIAGVCQSMASKLGLTPTVMRLIWIVVAFVSFGTGVLLYMACAVSFPNVDEMKDSGRHFEQKKALGVCLRLSKTLRIETAIVRVVMILLLVASLGVTALLYLVLHFVIPENPEPMR